MKLLNGAGTRALLTARAFTVAQRTIALIGVAVLVLGGIALMNWMGKPTYVPMYAGLSSADGSAVVAILEKDKVDYQLQGDGTILVPADKVNSERLAAAAAGLPSSSNGGYSLLDKMGVTASEFQQNVTYKRAIEGELAKTIGSIDGISSASVQLAVPEKTVFSDEQQDPTASVFVNVGQPLDSKQVAAIVHLVSAAYPGLSDDHVSVVNQQGDTLSSMGGGAAGSAADQAGDYESRTQSKVQALLDRTLGPGQAAVTVAADVSNSSGTTRSQVYTSPDGSPTISESTNDQTLGGSGAGGSAASGVLGSDTTSNGTGGVGATTTPNGTGGSSSGSGKTYLQKQGVKNNALNSTTTEETITPGTLRRQTIAVALNSKTPPAISTTMLQGLVENAAGVDRKRGDTVSVTPVPFSTAAQAAAAKALKASTSAQSAEGMTSIITTAIKVVGGLVLFVLVVGLLRKLFKRPEPTVVDGGTLNIVPTPVPGEPVLMGGGLHGSLGGAAPTAVLATHPMGMGPAGALGGTVDPEFAQLQADVDALAASDPAQTAGYLRALMAERA